MINCCKSTQLFHLSVRYKESFINIELFIQTNDLSIKTLNEQI